MSSCDSKGLSAKISKRSVDPIVKGSDLTLEVQLYTKPGNDPLKIVDFLGATAQFLKTDDTVLSVTGTVASGDQGTVKFELSELQTPDLADGEERSMQVTVDSNGARNIFQLSGELNIQNSLF